MNQFKVSDEMVTRYILNREKELNQLKLSLADRDFSFVASKGHNLKGTAESFGFPELGIIGQELETAALVNDEPAIQVLIQKIEQWLRPRLKK